MALMLLYKFLLGSFESSKITSLDSKSSNFTFSKFSKDSWTGEVIAFHNYSFTIFLNVGILFGSLLLQLSSKFIKTSKIRNSEEIPYGLRSVTNSRYEVWQLWGLQSVIRVG